MTTTTDNIGFRERIEIELKQQKSISWLILITFKIVPKLFWFSYLPLRFSSPLTTFLESFEYVECRLHFGRVAVYAEWMLLTCMCVPTCLLWISFKIAFDTTRNDPTPWFRLITNIQCKLIYDSGLHDLYLGNTFECYYGFQFSISNMRYSCDEVAQSQN